MASQGDDGLRVVFEQELVGIVGQVEQLGLADLAVEVLLKLSFLRMLR